MCPARLKEQLAVLQQESEEEQRTSMREVMKLRDQLCQACVDRDEAQQEVHRLAEALEQATTTKVAYNSNHSTYLYLVTTTKQ